MDFQYYDSKLRPNFDGGLIDNKYVAGTLFIFKTKVQRNILPRDYRLLDGETTTMAYISGTKEMFELINNPPGVTTDSDWSPIDLGTKALIPVGTWDAITGIASDDTNALLDTDALNRNGELFFVDSAPGGHTETYAGLFQGQEVTVNDGDWIVSVGKYWSVIPEGNVTWATLPGIPQTILDYVTGTIISHSHTISEVTGLQTALNTKFDSSNVVDETVGFGSIPDAGLGTHIYSKTHYYRRWSSGVGKSVSTYSAAEIDTKIGAGGGDTIAATAVDYDNTTSGLTAIEVQAAIDELSLGTIGWKVAGDTGITADVRILGAFDVEFGDGGGGNPTLFGVDAVTFDFNSSTTGVISADDLTISGELNILVIDNTGFEVTLDGTDTFREAADYSGNYVDRSYIAKKWADDTFIPVTGTKIINALTLDLNGITSNIVTGSDNMMTLAPSGIFIGSLTRVVTNRSRKKHSSNTGIEHGLNIDIASTGTPVAGFGGGLEFDLETDTTLSQFAGGAYVAWIDVTHATRTSEMSFSIVDSGSEANVLTLNKDEIKINQGHIFIKEIAAPTTDVATWGRVYADAADSKLKYRSDSGTVYDLTTAVGAGADKNIQFNDGGVLAGFGSWDKVTNSLTLDEPGVSGQNTIGFKIEQDLAAQDGSESYVGLRINQKTVGRTSGILALPFDVQQDGVSLFQVQPASIDCFQHLLVTSELINTFILNSESNSVFAPVQLYHRHITGAGGIGKGLKLPFIVEGGSGDAVAAQSATVLTTATGGSEVADYYISVIDGGTLTERLRVKGDGTVIVGAEIGAAANRTIKVGGDSGNGDLILTPYGAGNVILGNLTLDADQTIGAGQDNYVLTYDHSSGLISLEVSAGGGGGAFSADGDTQITPSTAILLDHASNNEIAFDLSGTANKAAGNVSWLFADVTDTASPGTFDLVDLQVGSVSKFKVDSIGGINAEKITLISPNTTGITHSISLTPSGALEASATWHGIHIDGSALDPTGTGADIVGIEIDFSGLDMTNEPVLHGIEITALVRRDAIHVKEGQVVINNTPDNTATSEFHALDIRVDETAMDSTSVWSAMSVTAVGGTSGEVDAILVRNEINPIRQEVGTFVTPSQTEFAGKKITGGTVWVDGDTPSIGENLDGNEIFVVDNDEIYVGAAAQFSQIEVIMGTGATKDCQPTFWYNTAADSWTQFFPDDETSGFQTSSLISWIPSSISGAWTGDGDPGAGDTTAGYWIKIIRTRNADPGTPIPTTIKTGTVVTYKWDALGDLEIGQITASKDVMSFHIFGQVRIDNRINDFAYFSHYDMASSTQYALRQNSAGATVLNGTTTSITVANSNAYLLNTTDHKFYEDDGSTILMQLERDRTAGSGWFMPQTPTADSTDVSVLVRDDSTGEVKTAAPVTYTRNATIVEDRTLLASASATTINNNNVIAALIADLQALGILG